MDEYTDDEDFNDLVNLYVHPRAHRQFRTRTNHFEKWNDQEYLSRLFSTILIYFLIHMTSIFSSLGVKFGSRFLFTSFGSISSFKSFTTTLCYHYPM